MAFNFSRAWKRLVAAATVWLVGFGVAAAQPPVWVVRDADSTVVIFGSVHVLPPGLDWKPKVLTDALAKADDLWFELPFDPASQAAGVEVVKAKGLLPPGESLLAKLTPAGRERLARLAPKLGLSLEQMDRLRPWLADVTVGLVDMSQRGAGAADGVEQTIEKATPPTALRKAFETADEQIGFFADAPEADQLASLEDTLRQIEEEPDAYNRLLAAWLSGDLKALQTEGLEPMKRASPDLFDRMITQRNNRWVEAITQRMAGSGETVIVVGAGHLVGPDGVPALLRARGFKVEGPR
ncbi:uncharacterized protein YbaP (TraB family) [Caulobacter ginsengisoli]|uniref:Uncharacterized protein YbaP (TraB family) n=1 Tax=Caulobacter ginsengisoli TaxID=400775 RepID=A0ABU0ITR5_9CAUL|nr:TraB/GumN family protein [Caulobacter ginsengisoli]MDQ0465397.1 uncharacterized protein YbaP (TraB family) [Caulobacter ginsengisoli]